MDSLLASPRRLVRALVAAGVVGAGLVTDLHTRALAMPDVSDIPARNGPAVVNISFSVNGLVGKNNLPRSGVS